MDSIAPSLLLRQPSPDSSNESHKGENPRKRRRANDPPHEVPDTPGPDASPEERRAARAQRNRIAAQSSRDRRKQEYSYLRDRISELEQENQLLRAGHFLPQALTSPALSSTSLESTPASTSTSADQWKRDIESENRDLRNKVANLERMFALIAPAAMNSLSPAPDAASTSVQPTPVAPDIPQSVPTRHLAPGGYQSTIPNFPFPPNPLALDRATADWLLSLLQYGPPIPQPSASLPIPAVLPVLSSISNQDQPHQAACNLPSVSQVPLGSPFSQGQDIADTTADSAVIAAIRATVPEMTFLPTPSTSHAGSELDFTEFSLEQASVSEPSAADAASTAIVEEMMSKYLNDMVSDQSWAWEARGHDTTDETKDVMTSTIPTHLLPGAAEVNVF
ncbi:hypothetical protein DACRYDRAFT_19535 [Dacryopinax primogenitus]|uniref:BZIP domain-containing protein n=1 Tax=Dacryopinax primogenitus (strain DJM 731) TaxID=1858805 RepID=M5GFI8_DACPD|nr:uncharacterized protein DACRYDRAFT_19535 [Dacryopinax primogenitus]EJU06342.1 hypothetical protein DACRYDRAFT_19535 [Dacryopinax primogenitus]